MHKKANMIIKYSTAYKIKTAKRNREKCRSHKKV